jgi:hypothetical protein
MLRSSEVSRELGAVHSTDRFVSYFALKEHPDGQ